MEASKKTAYTIIGAIALASLPIGAAHAQATAKSVSPEKRLIAPSAVSSFVSQFGVPIIVGDKPMLPSLVNVDTSNSPRLAQLVVLTSKTDATWRKIYRITPANSESQVTTLAQAREMVDDETPVTISIDSGPTAILDKMVARADGAYVTFPDGAPTSHVTLNIAGATTSAAIAAVAAATHTHWLPVYYVAAVSTPNLRSTVVIASGQTSPASIQDYEQRYLNNGPFIIHTAPAPPPTTLTEAAPGGTDAANQLAPLTIPAAGSQPAQQQQPNIGDLTPAYVRDPYGYTGMMYAPSYTFGGGGQVINPFGP